MKKLYFFLVLLILFCFKFAFSIGVDFRGAQFSNITNLINLMESNDIKIDFVVLDSPFRLTKDGGIDDFEHESVSFKEISSFLTQKGITYYIYLSFFTQPRYYSRKLWNFNDFDKVSIRYSSVYKLDYTSPSTRNKIKSYLANLKSKGYKLFLDLTFFQDVEVEEIIQIYGSELDNSLFLLNNRLPRTKGKSVCVNYYWDLRRKFFLYPQANFKGIDDYSLSGEVHLIGSEELSINNVSTMSYLLIKKEKILIDYRMMNDYIIKLIKFIEKDSFRRIYFSDRKMIFSSNNKLIILNMEDEFSAFEVDYNISKKEGVYFSILGGGFLTIDKKLNFLLFPGTISFYLIE